MGALNNFLANVGVSGTVATQVQNTDATAVPVAQKAGTSFAVQVGNLDAAAVPVQPKATAIWNVAIPARQRDPYYSQFASSFAAVVGLAANAAQILVAPAANVNGVIVHSAGFFYRSANRVLAVIIAKAGVAPAFVHDGAVLCMNRNETLNGAEYACDGELPREMYLPAGMGLYFMADVNEVAGGDLRYANYTAL